MHTGFYNLQRISVARHPVHGCKAALGPVIPLDGQMDSSQLRELEDKLEMLSRSRNAKHLRPRIATCPPPEQTGGESRRTRTAAEERVAALQARVRLRATGASAGTTG